jgi:hypothetical protein
VITAGIGIMALVVVTAGAAKVASPAAFGSAAGSVGLPLGSAAGRAVGAAEVAVGVLAVLWWRPAFAALAVLCVLFAVTAWRALRAGAPSCGCFGAVESPPSWIHVTLDLAGAAVLAAGWALDAAAPSAGAWPVIALGTVSVIAMLTFGAEVARGVQQVASHGPTFQAHARAEKVARS